MQSIYYFIKISDGSSINAYVLNQLTVDSSIQNQNLFTVAIFGCDIGTPFCLEVGIPNT